MDSPRSGKESGPSHRILPPGGSSPMRPRGEAWGPGSECNLHNCALHPWPGSYPAASGPGSEACVNERANERVNVWLWAESCPGSSSGNITVRAPPMAQGTPDPVFATPSADVASLQHLQILSRGWSRGLSPAWAWPGQSPGLPEDEVLLDTGSHQLAKADDLVAVRVGPGQACEAQAWSLRAHASWEPETTFFGGGALDLSEGTPSPRKVAPLRTQKKGKIQHKSTGDHPVCESIRRRGVTQWAPPCPGVVHRLQGCTGVSSLPRGGGDSRLRQQGVHSPHRRCRESEGAEQEVGVKGMDPDGGQHSRCRNQAHSRAVLRGREVIERKRRLWASDTALIKSC